MGHHIVPTPVYGFHVSLNWLLSVAYRTGISSLIKHPPLTHDPFKDASRSSGSCGKSLGLGFSQDLPLKNRSWAGESHCPMLGMGLETNELPSQACSYVYYP